MTKNYILIVRTIHGEPDPHMTICLRGNHGQTEKIPLGKSQVNKKQSVECTSSIFSRIKKHFEMIKPIYSYSCLRLILVESIKSNFMSAPTRNLKNGNIIMY
jgi:hypothetical protein